VGVRSDYRGYALIRRGETLALAARIRDARMPCDVWGVEPGWQSRGVFLFVRWTTTVFPDPDAFLAKMRAMNFRMEMSGNTLSLIPRRDL